jgi:hypothetical protein
MSEIVKQIKILVSCDGRKSQHSERLLSQRYPHIDLVDDPENRIQYQFTDVHVHLTHVHLTHVLRF